MQNVNINWSAEEVTKLKELGFFVFSHEKYPAVSKRTYEIQKQMIGGNVGYLVGEEGRAMDVDGDWGWCRSWSTKESLEDALKVIQPI